MIAPTEVSAKSSGFGVNTRLTTTLCPSRSLSFAAITVAVIVAVLVADRDCYLNVFSATPLSRTTRDSAKLPSVVSNPTSIPLSVTNSPAGFLSSNLKTLVVCPSDFIGLSS